MLVETKKRREDWLDGTAENSNSAQQQKQMDLDMENPGPVKAESFSLEAGETLLTNSRHEIQYKRNMAPSAECGLCGAGCDSWRHALLECHMAKSVWALCDEQIVEHISMIQAVNAKVWIFELMDSVRDRKSVV